MSLVQIYADCRGRNISQHLLKASGACSESSKIPINAQSFLGLSAGAVVVAGGIWTVIAFVVDHKDGDKKRGAPAVVVSGQGIASGRDTKIEGPVNFGLDEKKMQEKLKENLHPIAEGQKETQEDVRELKVLVAKLLASSQAPA